MGSGERAGKQPLSSPASSLHASNRRRWWRRAQGLEADVGRFFQVVQRARLRVRVPRGSGCPPFLALIASGGPGQPSRARYPQTDGFIAPFKELMSRITHFVVFIPPP